MARHTVNEGLAWTRIPPAPSYWSIVRVCSPGGCLVTRTTLHQHMPRRDPHSPASTPPPTVNPFLKGGVLQPLPTPPFITQSGCLTAAHSEGRAHPSTAIIDRPALPLRWPDQSALPLRSALGAILSTLHMRMLSFCVRRSARLISCRACGDDLECSQSVRAFYKCRTSCSVFVWKICSLFLYGTVTYL